MEGERGGEDSSIKKTKVSSESLCTTNSHRFVEKATKMSTVFAMLTRANHSRLHLFSITLVSDLGGGSGAITTNNNTNGVLDTLIVEVKRALALLMQSKMTTTTTSSSAVVTKAVGSGGGGDDYGRRHRQQLRLNIHAALRAFFRALKANVQSHASGGNGNGALAQKIADAVFESGPVLSGGGGQLSVEGLAVLSTTRLIE